MKKTLVASILAAAVLGACGGGDDAPPPATTQVPASASQSPGAFITYLQLLVVSAADLFEPVDTSGVTPPADDVSEPTKID